MSHPVVTLPGPDAACVSISNPGPQGHVALSVLLSCVCPQLGPCGVRSLQA